MPDASAGDTITICVLVCDTIEATLPPIVIEDGRKFGKFVPIIVTVWPPFTLIQNKLIQIKFDLF